MIPRSAARRFVSVTAVAGAVLGGALVLAPAATSGPTTVNTAVVQASAYAKARGYVNAVTVMDMKTGQTWQSGSTTRLFGAGSVTKVLIATKMLATGHMSGSDATRAYSMITRSDDNAANYLWGKYGSTGIIGWVKDHYKIADLGRTNDLPGYWGNTHITSHGMAELYYHILRDPKVGPWLTNAMRHYNCSATDGTNQCFGIPQATTGAGVKQGWSAGYGSTDNPNNSIIHSTGLVSGDRYAVVILTEGVGTAHLSDSRGVVHAEANVVTAMAKLVLTRGTISPILPTAAEASGDTNGDGRTDLVATRPTDGTLWLYKNTGVASHPYTNSGIKVGQPGWNVFDLIQTGDVDGNRRADLLGRRPSDGSLWLYKNTGNSDQPYTNSGVKIGLSGWNQFDRIQSGDANGDGWADLVASRPDGTLWLYLNSHNVSKPFKARIEIGGSGWQQYDRLAMADVNADGRADLVTTWPDGSVWLYVNNRNVNKPFLARTEIIPSGWQANNRLIVGDVDGNKRADIAARRRDGSLWVYLNTGSLTAPYPSATKDSASGWNVFDRMF